MYPLPHCARAVEGTDGVSPNAIQQRGRAACRCHEPRHASCTSSSRARSTPTGGGVAASFTVHESTRRISQEDEEDLPTRMLAHTAHTRPPAHGGSHAVLGTREVCVGCVRCVWLLWCVCAS